MIRRKGKALDKPIYANLLLRDGKIMFWSTGEKKYEKVRDFHNSFYYTGIKVTECVKNWNYEVVSVRMRSAGMDGYHEAQEFYRRYELHEEFVGEKPY